MAEGSRGAPAGPSPGCSSRSKLQGRHSPFQRDEGIRQGHEEACCFHPFASTPCQLCERQISASSPNSHSEAARRREGWQRGQGEAPARAACLLCRELVFLATLCFTPDGMQFLLLYPTVEHQSGGIAPSSPAPCVTQPCCEHRPWVTSGSCCRPPPGAPALPRACGSVGPL